MDNQGKINKPISDEDLYDAGVNRDMPEREPLPPPPLRLPKDMNWSSVGVEYRAMGGVTTPPPVQARRRSSDKAFAWVAAWQPAPPASQEEPAPDGEDAEAGDVPTGDAAMPDVPTEPAAGLPPLEA